MATAWNGTGYRPNDISGNDYAGMAGMSATDRAALDAASASWKAAQAAGDKAAMDAAHRQAEALRSKYGYSGGADGSQYLPNPTYESPYQQQIDSLLGQMGSYGSFDYGPAPTYENRYAQQQQELLDRLLNYGDFEWSKEEDPLWPVYKKQYLREGERATANALGQASAASGGRPSSYAVNAATQAGDYYATKLNDIIPQLYQQAYDRWANKYNMMQQDLGAVNNQEQLDYAKFLDQLSQYNTDRGFAYNQYADDYNRLQSALGAYQGQDQTQYGRFADQVNWNYQREQDAVEQQQRQQDFYRQQLDAILQNGGTPSAQLLEQSGYSGEYAQALEAAWQRQQAEDQKTFAQQQLDAMLQAGRVPSADLIARSGYSNEYVQALASYYQQQIAQAAAKGTGSGSSGRRSSSGGSKSGSGGGSSGGGGEDYDGLFAAAKQSQNPKNFIESHYKEFGFTSKSGLYDQYVDEYTYDQSKVSAVADGLLTDLRKYYASKEDQFNKVQQEYKSGGISYDDYKWLLDRLGLL